MERVLRFVTASFFILLLFFSAANIKAQVTFTEPDPGNNFGTTNPGDLMGFAWGDYDGDGDLDFLICGSPNALYKNDLSNSSKFTLVSGNYLLFCVKE